MAFLKNIFRNPRIMPGALILWLIVWGIGWHVLLIYTSPYSITLFLRALVNQITRYAAIYLFVAGGLLRLAWRRENWRWPLAILASILLIAVTVMRLVDGTVFFFYGSHVDENFWHNAFNKTAAGGMLFSRPILESYGMALLYLTGTATMMVLAWKSLARHSQDVVGLKRSYRRQFVALLLVIGCMQVTVRSLVSRLRERPVNPKFYMQYFPEAEFVRSLVYMALPTPEVKLDASDVQKLAADGLRVRPNERYPLRKASIYLEPHQVSVPVTRPNLLVIMGESLSAWFLETHPEVTTHLNAFRKDSLSFERVYNANTPTLQGIFANLASSLHLFRTTIASYRQGNKEIDSSFEARRGGYTTTFPMMSLLLKDQGYQSYHFRGAPGSFAQTEEYLRRHGYVDFYSYAHPEFRSEMTLPAGPWGAWDADLFRFLRHWLERRSGSQPFLLSVKTTDTHHPYEVPFKVPVKDPVLRTIYTTDQAFGRFWNWFKISKWAKNTIVIVTADHALFPTMTYLATRHGDNPGYYDRVPLMLRVPWHPEWNGVTDTTLGTSLDLAPTLLEAAGLDTPNAFLGLSLLSERKQYPFLMARINLMKKFGYIPPVPWTDEDQKKLVGWLTWLSSTGRIWPQYVPPKY